MRTRLIATIAIAAGALTSATHGQQFVEIFPTGGHQANNTVPFTVGGAGNGITMHQVFASSLFSNVSGGVPISIERLTFTGQVTGYVTLRLGYTNAIPSATLLPPDPAGGGAPNAAGSMHDFFDAFVSSHGTTSTSFDMVYEGDPFVYDPAQGNLLLEVHIPIRDAGTASSRGLSNTAEASRTYQVHGGSSGGSNQASRIEFTFTLDTGDPCYANCDGSFNPPILTVDDFTCFINEFAAAQSLPHEQQVAHYANCDGSTSSPALTVDDFTCFINAFAQGCP